MKTKSFPLGVYPWRLSSASKARFIASLSFGLAALPSLATIYYVSPGGSNTNPGTRSSAMQTIQAALNQASPGDTITLEDGTYSGPGNTNLTITKAVKINSLDGPSKTIIDCQGSSTANSMAFTYSSVGTSSAPAQLVGVTIQNGYEDNSSEGVGVGAVEMEKSVVYLSDCVFSNNTGGLAGAILEQGGTSNVSNCSFVGNTSPLNTGAFLNEGVASFANCRFAGNSGSAAAIHSTGNKTLTCTVADCSFTGNTSEGYAAVVNDNYAVMQVIRCSFTGNTSPKGTPALYNNNGTAISVESTVFKGNSGGFGAGFACGGSISNPNETNTLHNCLFVNNSAINGAAIAASANITIQGCTFAGNLAYGSQNSPAVGVISVGGGATAVISDSILWDSVNLQLNYYYTTEIAIENSSPVYVGYSDVQGGYAGTGNINTNPLFTADYHVQDNSPCVGAGTALTPIPTDLAGRYRSNPPTMGAYETGGWNVVASAPVNATTTVTLLRNSANETILVTVDTSTAEPTTTNLGTFADFQPVGLTVGPDGHYYITWKLTDGSGNFEIWNYNPTNGAKTITVLGDVWIWYSTTVDSSGNLHVTFQKATGEMQLWIGGRAVYLKPINSNGTTTKE